MDPGDVLVAAGHRAADAEPERRQHLRQRAAVAVEHDAGAHLRRRACRARGRRRRPPPTSTHTSRQEVAPRRGVLVERLFAVRAVVADRRGAEQHRRRLAELAIVRAPSPSTRLRVPSTRLSRIARLALRAPALGDRLAGEVHDGVASGERRRRRRLAAAGPRRPHRPSPRLRARPLGVAREHRHLRAALAQRTRPARADQARRPRDRHARSRSLIAQPLTRGSRTRAAVDHLGAGEAPATASPWAKPTSCPASAVPAARACSATAAATAGATSRLNTDGMM